MLAVMIDRFLSYLRLEKQASPHTIRAYSGDLNSLRKFLEHRIAGPCQADHEKDPSPLIPLSALTSAAINSFFEDCRKQKLRPETIRRRYNSFCSCFRYAIDRGMLTTNPLKGVARPRQAPPVPQLVSMGQIDELLDAPLTQYYLGLRDRLILELFVYTAMTTSEMVALDRTDFDFRKHRLTVGVGFRRRDISLSKHIAKRLDSYLNDRRRFKTDRHHNAQIDSKAVFLNCHGTRLSARSVDRRIAEYVKDSMEQRITPQIIRETVAVDWLQAGKRTDRVKQTLGLKKMSTDIVYLKAEATGCKDSISRITAK